MDGDGAARDAAADDADDDDKDVIEVKSLKRGTSSGRARPRVRGIFRSWAAKSEGSEPEKGEADKDDVAAEPRKTLGTAFLSTRARARRKTDPIDDDPDEIVVTPRRKAVQGVYGGKA